MKTITDLLQSHHTHCDELFAQAEAAASDARWEEARASFEAFRQAMDRHFGAEEEVLFPAFEARTGMSGGPTWVMRSEHVQMRGLMERMAEALARRDQSAYLGESETLLMLMRQHNLKEEQILYPMTDRALGQDTELLATLEGGLK